MRCQPLSALLAQAGPALAHHVDYLSLDVEGAELGALMSVDWGVTSFSLLTIENASPAVHAFLAKHRMVAMFCILIDTAFVHADHAPAVDAWFRTVGSRLHKRIGGSARALFNASSVPLLSNRTSDCRYDYGAALPPAPTPRHAAAQTSAGRHAAAQASTGTGSPPQGGLIDELWKRMRGGIGAVPTPSRPPAHVRPALQYVQ
jgi:hypothetical protein